MNINEEAPESALDSIVDGVSMRENSGNQIVEIKKRLLSTKRTFGNLEKALIDNNVIVTVKTHPNSSYYGNSEVSILDTPQIICGREVNVDANRYQEAIDCKGLADISRKYERFFSSVGEVMVNGKAVKKIDTVKMIWSGIRPINLTLRRFKDAVGKNTEIYVPYGMLLVAGGTESGKTTLLRSLSNELQCRYEFVGEPELPSSYYSMAEVSNLIAAFLESDESVMILDSLTFLLYASGKESAGAGGVSTSFFRKLIEINQLCAYYGKTLICSVNAMSLDEKIHSDLESRVSAYLRIVQKGVLEYSGRYNLVSRNKSTLLFEPEFLSASSDESNGSSNQTRVGFIKDGFNILL